MRFEWYFIDTTKEERRAESDMASECCLSVTKYFLFLFNLIFFLLGLFLLGFGLWIRYSETGFLISAHLYLPLSLFSYLLVISGSVTLLLGFFGSIGALKEVKCMLATYFILLTVLLAAQIIGTVLLFTQRSVFENSVDDHVVELIKSYEKNNTSHFQESIEILQRTNCKQMIKNWLDAHIMIILGVVLALAVAEILNM
ncbi:hypothetical protein QTP70_031958 [Hemibagrus guttatus]|uniref:Uncharacterized protein n=1 Tax=Hemibagrus guttatus TaxID=175788 RepID=A0AAE0QS68_9TELE|nr:hypothetical protein QTP70_031958 [Hemibagrus guttatus]